MDAIVHQRFINLAPLAGHAQTVDFRGETLIVWGIFGIADHVGWRKLAQLSQKARMILIFILKSFLSAIAPKRERADQNGHRVADSREAQRFPAPLRCGRPGDSIAE